MNSILLAKKNLNTSFFFFVKEKRWGTRLFFQNIHLVDCVWNVMSHAQKPDFVFARNGRVHLNRRGVSVQSTADSRGVRISGSNAGYTMFRGSVKSTGYPLHSPVSPSLPLLCVTVCHHISTGVYHILLFVDFNPLNAELNPICHLLALIGAHHIFHVSRLKFKSHLPSAGIFRSSPYSPR